MAYFRQETTPTAPSRLQPGDHSFDAKDSSPTTTARRLLRKHDFERAIADFEAAIKSARIIFRASPAATISAASAAIPRRYGMPADPAEPIFALAYNDRGISFAAKNDSTAPSPISIAAITSNRFLGGLYISRQCLLSARNYDRPFAKLRSGIRLNPKDAMAIRTGGVARYGARMLRPRH